MKTCYAIYRKPEDGNRCAIVEAERCRQITCEDLDAAQGFVIAPFEANDDTPMVLIEGTAEEYILSGAELLPPPMFQVRDERAERKQYGRCFAVFHAAIRSGRLSKVILSRLSREKSAEPINPLMLFRQACRLFPHCFVALFYTPETGTWLTATPEILLEEIDGQAHTMALAGTMSVPDNVPRQLVWSKKNRREQRYVADYIRERLALPSERLTLTEPTTIVAGNVAHLRSDFRFALSDVGTFGELVSRLHPTPAVCGVPSQEARAFILAHEPHPRRYYSGFCGPIRQAQASHIYVMLRCMNIRGNCYDLYAGGGLVGQSLELEEWDETEAKLYAMRACLSC